MVSRNAVRSSQPPLLPSEGHTQNTQTSQDSSFLMAINGCCLAGNAFFLFPTIMITIQMLTAQGDLSTGAENIIWDTNQILLERGLGPLHVAFLKCWLFFYFAEIFSKLLHILKKDVFYSVWIRSLLFTKLVNITDSTSTNSMSSELLLPESSTDRDTPSRNIDLNLIQEEKCTAIFFPVFRPDNITI